MDCWSTASETGAIRIGGGAGGKDEDQKGIKIEHEIIPGANHFFEGDDNCRLKEVVGAISIVTAEILRAKAGKVGLCVPATAGPCPKRGLAVPELGSDAASTVSERLLCPDEMGSPLSERTAR